MGNTSIKIEIDRSKTGGTFTNYDIIKGVVRLTTNTELTLNSIQVKLEGISKSIVTVSQYNQNGKKRKDKKLIDLHKLLYDTVIVFPPANIRNVSNSREFTLTPGNYDYSFQFKLPLHSSCSKIQGVTNKLQFVSNSMEFVPSHGSKHLRTQLPPSLSGIDEFANVKYFVKVTAKRSSILKANLRNIDPFIFLPLDLNINNNDPRQSFIRKEMIFRDKLPEIVAVNGPIEEFGQPEYRQPKQRRIKNTEAVTTKRSGFFAKLFKDDDSGSTSESVPRSSVPKYSRPISVFNRPKVDCMNLAFFLEVRFRYPTYLIPTKLPNYKIFLLTKSPPNIFTLHNIGSDETSGLGAIYLQKLHIELLVITGILSQGNKATNAQKESICDNNFSNVRFDLRNCVKSTLVDEHTTLPLYELEIPKQYFNNAILPDYLSPSFKTCNISRRYKLKITFGFSPDRLSKDERAKEIKYVTLETDVKVLSGLSMTSELEKNLALHPPTLRNDSAASEDSPTSSLKNSTNDTQINQVVENPATSLPTYDDVLRESAYQDDSEHLNARRRYQQHEEYYTNIDEH